MNGFRIAAGAVLICSLLDFIVGALLLSRQGGAGYAAAAFALGLVGVVASAWVFHIADQMEESR